MLSEKALREFKRIWEEERGEIISDEFAMEQAVSLLTSLDVIYRPLKKAWLDEPTNDIPKL